MAWEMSRSFCHTVNLRHKTGEGVPYGGREAEVQGVRERVPARGAVRVRAVLRPARGRLRPRRSATTSASCAGASRAGPQSIWRYADFLPLAGGPPGPVRASWPRASGLPGRLHAADPRRPARRAPRACARCGSRTTPPTRPTRSRTASSRSPSARARELGFETLACASTGNLGQLRRRPRRRAGAALLRLHPRRPRGAEGARDRRLRRQPGRASRGNYDDVNRLCTELSAEHDDWAFVNINMRPYYAEGSKTVAFEIVEQLGWELPDRCVVPIASGSLFTKVAPRLRGVDRARPRQRPRCRR